MQNIKKIFIGIVLCSLVSHTLSCSFLTCYSSKKAEDIQLYHELNKAIQVARVRDASSFPIPDFPYLRTNRFLVGIGKNLTHDAPKAFWVEQMRQLAMASYTKEIRNLPLPAFLDLADRLGFSSNREFFLDKLSLYSEAWLKKDKMQNNFYASIARKMRFPSEYCPVMRWVGLYPAFSIPILWGTAQTYAVFRKWHKTPLEELKVHGEIMVYALPTDKTISASTVLPLFASSRRNAFGVPELNPEEIEQLAYAFAPVLQQDVTADDDKIGAVEWQDGRVHINSAKPIVYYYLSHAFIKGKPALQMNYVVWYSARSGPYAPWMERGPLDGFTTRITFAAQGEPLMVDVTNNCGCYHFFVPRQEKTLRVKSHILLDPLIVTWLPNAFPQKSLHLSINAGWHQVQHIDAADIPTSVIPYQLLPYDILESLPHPDGHTESVFNSKGIMKNSQRIEPWFFFSTGIPKVGYMRQREHHPIKLVGQEYFEDPELFDRNFEFK